MALTQSDKRFSVHKYILVTRCTYFSGLFSHSWKDNQNGESTYDIESMSAEVFELLLEFLYTGEVTTISMETATELLIVANQYTLPRLKELCEQFLFNHLDEDTVVDCYFGAQLNMCSQLEKYCIYLMQQPHIFTSIPSSEFEKVDPEVRKKIEDMYRYICNANSERRSLDRKKEELRNMNETIKQ